MNLKKMDTKKIFISFSGGRTSALMARLIMEAPNYKDYEKLVLFANTGKELEATLEFVDRCDKEYNLNLVWVEAVVDQKKGKGVTYKVVDFETASRNGEPFEAVIKKLGLPSKVYRHCTRDLKQGPMHKYAKDILGKDYLTAIGIRADELHRVGKDPTHIYPLIETKITEKHVREYWKKQPFDLELKDYQGNCDLCFLKSTRKKLTVIKEIPDTVDWWARMEETYSDGQRNIFDMHRGQSIPDLLEMSKRPFAKALDKQDVRDAQSTMFDIDMDMEFDCFCKNT